MNASLYKKATVLNTVFGFSLLISLIPSPSHAIDPKIAIPIIIGTGIPLVMLYARKPLPEARPRYNINKVKKVSAIGTPQYWRNLWYLFYDGLIGQSSASSKAKVNDRGEIIFSVPADSFGVLGNLDDYIKPTETAQRALAFFFGLYNFNNLIKTITGDKGDAKNNADKEKNIYTEGFKEGVKFSLEEINKKDGKEEEL